MITSLLIANRGEIACRIMRTCRRLGIRTVAVYSTADAEARHVHMADAAVHIGPAPAADSYLAIDKIIAAAARANAEAIHPGFGFLAENDAFAQACRDAGVIFVGPSPQAIAAMGNKRAAKELVAQAGVPTIPGYSGPDQSDERLRQEAERIGFPVMVKAAAGGGGKGMRVVHAAADLPDALASARREALAAFGADELLLEKALRRPRHVEIQVVGDRQGNVIHLGERECSIQRRHQKVIEEAPSPAVTADLRRRMGATAVAAAKAIGYSNAGTVEFLLDEDGAFYFLEMNTRLQVEHPVTEMITGIDIVAWQIAIAEGRPLPLAQEEVRFHGHAIEARVYAENPAADFLPVTGAVRLWRPPEGAGVRVESGLRPQDHVSIHYDPMLAKIIAHGEDRETAARRLARALETTTLLGLTNNIAFLHDVLRHPAFLAGATNTDFIPEHFAAWRPPAGDETLALIAATVAQFTHHPRPETSQGYWRNNPNRPQRYRYKLPDHDEPVEVHLTPTAQGYAVTPSTAPETTHQVVLNTDDDPDWVLTVDGYRQRVTAVAADDVWWLQTARGVVRLEVVPLLPRPHGAADAGGSLRAPMPGSVLAVLVEEGQQVTAGQPLLKLEAMKMEHTIRTGAAGIVEKIYYRAGDTVEADAQLVKIKERDD